MSLFHPYPTLTQVLVLQDIEFQDKKMFSFKDRKSFVPFALEFTVNDVKSNTGVILVLM